ncbi:hypothetical protein MKZ24_27630 [Paenibacillus sp. FSL R7-0297]|uniref:hypothetical protein n=1 Tax=unclassified Paenibacillus TaxID=185978 RepID=UPI0004F6A92C|nr:hypothetical protein [Paenibacillus sp. FSL R5-0912]AIQ40446.1 hypothetical protein R50912_10740 [Paenibacillus sp. FSL R5-0912]
MKNKFVTGIRAVSQVFFIAVVHLFVIHFLNIKAEAWDEAAVRQAIIIYSVLFIILYVTCMMSLVTRRVRYNLLWFCVSTIPSVGFLFLLHKDKVSEPAEYGFIDLKFDSGLFELVMIFPFYYLVIQIILVVALWVLKFPKRYEET